MNNLIGNQIYLRALEPEDINYLHELENQESLWEISNTQKPMSLFELENYLLQSHKDIYEMKQLRLVICKKDSPTTVGLIDLFDFDPKNLRAGIGIVIYPNEFKGENFAGEALSILIKYSFSHLNLHQLYCNINEKNQISINLFESKGFTRIGIKKDWNYNAKCFSNEVMYQLIDRHVY